MISTITGNVMSVVGPMIYHLKVKNKRTVEKDYYHLFVKTINGNMVKLYFPVTANVAEYDKGSIYSRKGFMRVLNTNTGKWVDYQIANPKKLVKMKVEVTGNVMKDGDSGYYMNKIQDFRVYG